MCAIDRDMRVSELYGFRYERGIYNMKYQINNAIIGYPGNTILKGVSLEVRNNEKIAIVGRTGCGKTTLLKVIAGIMTTDNIDSDEEFSIVKAKKLRIGYLRQMAFQDEAITAREELLKVFDIVFQLQEEMKILTDKMQKDGSKKILDEYAEISEEFESLGGYTYKTDIEHIFTQFGFQVDELERPLHTFSGGQKTRIAFVELILSRPDIMLLDEPTNHLDMPTIEWLEGYLRNYNKAVIIVSHDRMFLDRVIAVTYEIEYNKMKRYSGNYSAFMEQKRLAHEKQIKEYEAQQKEIERLTTLVEKFKNTPTKVAMTRSKLKQIEHMEKIPKPQRYNLKTFQLQFSPRIAGVKDILTVNKLKIGYDTILSEVTFKMEKGQKLAIIGENGKGKSTLLKTIVGMQPSLGGNYHYGVDTEWGYFDQELLEFSGEKTVIDEFWDEYPKMTQSEVRTALGNFLFAGDDVFKTLGQLSGGEKVRLALVKLMKKQPNLLILDEPTNHMDMVGKEALEKMLKKYTGTIIFVSHDRYFVKEIADSLLVYENNKVHYYPCVYEEYLEKRKQASDEYEEYTDVKIRVKEKMKVHNPGKEKAKKEQRITKVESLIDELERKVKKLKIQYDEPEIATNFKKLGEIDEEITVCESELETLLMEWAGLV